MSFEWCRLEALAASQSGAIAIGPFGSRMKSDCYTDSGVAIIRGTNLSGSRHFSGEFVFVSDEKAKELGNANVSAGDLVFPHRGSIGSVGLVPDDGVRYALSSSLMKITLDTERATPAFYYYFFRSQRGQAELLKNASQVGTPGIATPLTSLRSCMVPCIPMNQQIAAVAILSSLDDRIALLRESNATLEAIAQALFKSWFVDFDPVRAKAEGREPEGTSAEVAGLFPDAFEESELGLLPKGWQVGPILATASLLSGGTPKTDRPDYWGGNIAWASAKDVSQSRNSALIRTERSITHKGLSESSTRLIPALATVLVARGATTGRMVFFGREMAMNQTCYALTSKIGTPIALYCHMKQEVDKLVNAAHGSVFDTITTSTFSQSKTVLPPKPLLECYERIANPVFQKVVANTETIDTLTELRDNLLPRLISGQLQLPEAEALLQDAA